MGNEAVLNALASTPVEMLNEGLEEIMSDVLAPMAEWAITGNRPEYELDQILEDGAVGVLTAALAQGGGQVVNRGTSQITTPLQQYTDPLINTVREIAQQKAQQTTPPATAQARMGAGEVSEPTQAQGAVRGAERAARTYEPDALVRILTDAAKPQTETGAYQDPTTSETWRVEQNAEEAQAFARAQEETARIARERREAQRAADDPLLRILRGEVETPTQQAPAQTPAQARAVDRFLDVATRVSKEAAAEKQARLDAAFRILTGQNVTDTQATGGETPSVGAAAEGFASGTRSRERTSRIHETSDQYTRARAEAAGIDQGTGAERRGAYESLFKYRTQSEAASQQRAGELLYRVIEGRREFIMDYDPEGFRAVQEELKNADAWSAIQTDAAQMIKAELERRVHEGTVSQEEFVDWLRTDVAHSVATAQGTQARAKWSRSDPEGQQSTLEAWDNIQKGKKSQAEKKAQFDKILQWNEDIKNAQSDADLKQIILDIANERRVLDGISRKQSKVMTALASSALNGLTTDQLRQFAYNSSKALTTDATPKDAGQVAKTIQVLMMLSNPKTAASNLAGNTSFYMLDALTMRGAALLDMAISKATGTRSVAMEGSIFQTENMSALIKAIQLSAAEVALDVDMGGSSRYGTGSSRTFKKSGNIVERALSTIERNQAFLLTTTDEAYKGAARATAQATQRLIDKGKIKTTDANYAQTQADELARYRTFQQDGDVAEKIQAIHDILNTSVLGIPLGFGDSGKRTGKGSTVHAFGVGDLVAPFVRVAGNLVSVGADYSPLNAAKGAAEIISTIADRVTQKGVDPRKQAKAVSDFARGMTGSAIALGVMELVKRGIIRRADDEEDRDVRAMNQAEGIVGTQVNLGALTRWAQGGFGEGATPWANGDTLVDLSRIEPLNFILSLGVELAQDDDPGIVSQVTGIQAENMPGPAQAIDRAASATGQALADAAADLPVVSGLGGIAQDVMVYHDPLVEALTKNLGKTAVSSMTPNILASIAKGTDDKQRDLYTGETPAEELRDYFKSRIPGLRENLPASTDMLGREKENPGGLAARLGNAMLNPVGVNEYTRSTESAELARLREATDDNGIYPNKSAPSTVSVSGQKIKLTAEEKTKYKQTSGDNITRYLQQFMTSSGYSRLTDEQKADAIAGIMAYGRAKATQELAKGHSKTYEMSGIARTFEKAVEINQATGLDLGKYYLLKAEHDRIGEGKETAAQKATKFALWLQGQGLTDGQRAIIQERLTYSYGGTAEANERELSTVPSLGLTLDEWWGIKGTMDADGNGAISQAEAQTALDASGLSRQQKRELWNVINKGWKKNPY